VQHLIHGGHVNSLVDPLHAYRLGLEFNAVLHHAFVGSSEKLKQQNKKVHLKKKLAAAHFNMLLCKA
jgi:hypothetical protein